MRRITLWLMAIVLGAILFGSGLAQPLGAQGASRAVTATLSGSAEVPSLETTASGEFTGTLSGGTLSFRLTSDAVGITQAHIHLGAVDANGGVVAFLFGPADPAVDSIDVSGTITAADLIGAVEGDIMAFAQALQTSTSTPRPTPPVRCGARSRWASRRSALPPHDGWRRRDSGVAGGGWKPHRLVRTEQHDW